VATRGVSSGEARPAQPSSRRVHLRMLRGFTVDESFDAGLLPSTRICDRDTPTRARLRSRTRISRGNATGGCRSFGHPPVFVLWPSPCRHVRCAANRGAPGEQCIAPDATRRLAHRSCYYLLSKYGRSMTGLPVAGSRTMGGTRTDAA